MIKWIDSDAAAAAERRPSLSTSGRSLFSVLESFHLMEI